MFPLVKFIVTYLPYQCRIDANSSPLMACTKWNERCKLEKENKTESQHIRYLAMKQLK